MTNKNISLNQYYNLIDKHINLVCSYTGNKNLYFVIKSCRLKPYSCVFGKFKTSELKLEKIWIDEYGNSLNIENNKIYINYNNNSIKKNKLIYTDMYEFINFNQTIKLSSFVCVVGDYISFIGFDGFLRTFNKNKKVSSLELGLDNLYELSDYLKIKDYSIIDKNTSQVKLYISQLPISSEFLLELNKNNIFALNGV